MTAEELTTPGGLTMLVPEWGALWERCPEATPFQSPEWLAPWWRHLGRGRLRVLAFREEGRLVGLAPCFERGPLRRVRLLGTGNTDYLELLAEPGWEEAAAREVAARFSRSFCDFQQLRAGSPLLRCSWPEGVRVREAVQEACPYLPLPSTVEEWEAMLPPRLRANLRYYRRRLEREGAVTFERASASTLPELMERFFELHGARWRRRKLPGVFSSGRVRAFHLEAASRFLERGWLRLHALRFRGEVAAVLYCFLCRGTLYYYGGGFDPDLARLSPGTVLTGHAMAEAVREGAAEFDFLRGDEPYKYAWGAADRHNQRLVVSRGALPQAWVRLEERVEAAVKGAIRRSVAAGRGPKAGPRASTDVAPPI